MAFTLKVRLACSMSPYRKVSARSPFLTSMMLTTSTIACVSMNGIYFWSIASAIVHVSVNSVYFSSSTKGKKLVHMAPF